jgi:hypothetical protein
MNKSADQELAERISQKISQENILTAESDRIKKAILTDKLKSEDWIMLIENTILKQGGDADGEED